MLALEALQADAGDCLLLRFGRPDKPSLVVIDGGPTGVYQSSLKPRLEQLREPHGAGPLPVRLVMVSHIDDDHIRGILGLFGELVEQRETNADAWCEMEGLWHNSFGDLVGDRDSELADEIPAVGEDIAPASAAIAASVAQGSRLREQAGRLTMDVNAPFGDLVTADGPDRSVADLGDGLSLQVVAPDAKRVGALRERWQRELERARARKAAARAVSYSDSSPYNLSSIVVLAEYAGRRLLLTGDARGDDILRGLEEAHLLKNGVLHVDVLKLPHHGSDRNVETDFFRRITADNYVISGDGKHGNPETATLEMITEARGSEDYRLYLTNRAGEGDLEQRLDGYIERRRTQGRPVNAIFRDPDALGVSIELEP